MHDTDAVTLELIMVTCPIYSDSPTRKANTNPIPKSVTRGSESPDLKIFISIKQNTAAGTPDQFMVICPIYLVHHHAQKLLIQSQNR